MSDELTEQQQQEQQEAARQKEAQTQHVFQTAMANLVIVMDQLESTKDERVDSVLESLDAAKADLEHHIDG